MAANRTLKEYATPTLAEPHGVIVHPNVEANTFELKPSLLSMVQQNQFSGSATEDPNLHLSIFLEYCGTLKLNGVTPEAIRLKLFPFSLRDRARAWFHSMPNESVTTWNQLRQAFLAKFFPPSKTAQLRNQITRFTQNDGESLYDAWERFKEMLRLCPHHGLEKWLIIHTFYNGLLYTTKMTVDAAAGGALMNKNIEEAYALIEDMAQNHYQWTSERAITAPSPQKKESGKYEVSALDHLASKVDALFAKFDKLSINAVAPSSSTPPTLPCEICGVIGHIGSECQLGASTAGPEQVNYAQRGDPFSNTYNPGWRNHPNFSYKNPPSNPSFQPAVKTPPGFQNNQRTPQKSNLETLLENFVLSQTKQNEEFKNQAGFLNESLIKLTSKVDSISTHNKMLETQISQVAQQVASSSKTTGMFPGQPEPNPKAQINALTLRSGKKLEEPKGISEDNTSESGKEKEISRESEVVEEEKEKPYVPPPPYKPKIPFPQRFAKSKLDDQFKKFVEMLKKLYINIPFTDALSQMPSYAKILKEILSKKRKIGDNETVALTAECSAIIQNKLPPKLKDPGSFSIPCVIGNETIEKAMCDLGASVSLMPLSLCKRLGIGELEPTTLTIQLADRSIKHPAGILENIPVKVGDIFIPADFIVMEIEEDSQVPILLGRPFLATAGAIIDVRQGKMAFNVGEEKILFEFENLKNSPSTKESVCMLNVINHCVKECSLAPTSSDGLVVCLTNNAGEKLLGDAQAYAKLLDENPPIKGLGVEEMVEERADFPPKETQRVELKPNELKENKTPQKVKSKVEKRARRKGIFTKPIWVDDVERKISHIGGKMKRSKTLKVWKVKGTSIPRLDPG